MRGSVFRFRSNDKRGHKQSGVRYIVILQSDMLSLSTVLAAPTSRSAREAVFRPEVQVNGQTTKVLLEQTTAVDVQHEVGEKVGQLDAMELLRVEEALKLVLGLF